VKKKLLAMSFLMVFIMLGAPTAAYAEAITSGANVDEFLLSIGVPMSVIPHLAEAQKHEIFTSLQLDYAYEIAFESFMLTTFNINNSNRAEIAGGFNVSYGDSTASFSVISPSDLTLSVMSVRVSGDTGITYIILPSFVWHNSRRLRNDAFAWSLHHGWEIVAGADPGLTIWARDMRTGSLLDSMAMAPSVAAPSGYGFYFATGTPLSNIAFEGHGSFRARQAQQNATRMIALSYVHDPSATYNILIEISATHPYYFHSFYQVPSLRFY